MGYTTLSENRRKLLHYRSSLQKEESSTINFRSKEVICVIATKITKSPHSSRHPEIVTLV
jgi:hypothetical protein